MAGVLLLAFVGFSVWRLTHDTSALDHAGTRFTGSFLHGVVDAIVSALWPFGEPQAGAVAIAAVAAGLAGARRYRLALLVLVAYGVLTGLELSIRIGTGLAHGQSLRHALVYNYPSGHAGRVPFVGAVLAVVLPARWRWPILAGTALLAFGVAADRIDSTLQTASDVIGGLLMGSGLAFAFAALARLIDRAPRPRPARQ